MQTIQHKRFHTRGGVHISCQVQACDGPVLLDERLPLLDTHAGVLLSCGVEYPGRYRRKDVLVINPPLRLSARHHRLDIEALNQRGQVMLPECERALSALGDSLVTIQGGGDHLICELRPGAGTTLADFREEERTRQPGVMTLLRALLEHFATPEDSILGLYGAFGYDLAFQFENIQQQLERPGEQRDVVLYLPDEVLLVEPANQQGQLYSYDFICRDRYGERQTTGGLQRRGPATEFKAADKNRGQQSDHAAGEYVSVVQEALRHFARGDLFEVVPGQVFSQSCQKRPSEVYRDLQHHSPSPYAALINLGNQEYLVAASPEMFVRVQEQEQGWRVETCPISGTVRRGRNALEDADNIRSLLNSGKDEIELSMCTDVDRNDKNRVCKPGSVRIVGRRQIELYSHLIHTVDHVEGCLQQHFDALDAFLAHTWAVTVTGAPKHRAMQFIEEHEKSPRGWYGGAFGMLACNGCMDTGLTLRTIHIQQGTAHVRAGATLLQHSNPEAEEAETRLKAEALLAALKPLAGKEPSADKEPSANKEPSAPPHANSTTTQPPALRALMVDHQDSFVHTLAAMFRAHGVDLETRRPEQARKCLASADYDLVILSPGPGRPAEFACEETLALCEEKGIAVFGVCLGLQAMVEYCGGRLGLLARPVHGEAGWVNCLQSCGRKGLLENLPQRFQAGRYHSLYAGEIPDALQVQAVTADRLATVMALVHRHLPWASVQFHPESLLSQQLTEQGLEVGEQLIANVINMAAEVKAAAGNRLAVVRQPAYSVASA